MSNQQAIDAIDSLKRDEYLNGTFDYNQGYNNALRHARNLIQSLPSEWISTADTLPDNKRILFYSDYGTIYAGAYEGNAKWYSNGEEALGPIIFWQPLPTPPIPNQP